jgi:ketosteroid isomerase-like protein
MTTSTTTSDSILVRYFAARDAGDFDTALSLFADDATYIGMKTPPPAPPGTAGLEAMEGRAAIAKSFALRGKRQVDHKIEVEHRVGSHAWLEGVSTAGSNPSKRFLCHAELNGAGLIVRFIVIAG